MCCRRANRSASRVGRRVTFSAHRPTSERLLMRQKDAGEGPLPQFFHKMEAVEPLADAGKVVALSAAVHVGQHGPRDPPLGGRRACWGGGGKGGAKSVLRGSRTGTRMVGAGCSSVRRPVSRGRSARPAPKRSGWGSRLHLGECGRAAGGPDLGTGVRTALRHAPRQPRPPVRVLQAARVGTTRRF